MSRGRSPTELGMTSAEMSGMSNRHPDTEHLMQFFDFAHLRHPLLRDVSRPSGLLADSMLSMLNDGPELTAGLRALLIAKDAFVRAAILQLDQVPVANARAEAVADDRAEYKHTGMS